MRTKRTEDQILEEQKRREAEDKRKKQEEEERKRRSKEEEQQKEVEQRKKEEAAAALAAAKCKVTSRIYQMLSDTKLDSKFLTLSSCSGRRSASKSETRTRWMTSAKSGLKAPSLKPFLKT